MATKIADIEVIARRQLRETVANFWSSLELTDIIAAGIRDMWRDIADLKQGHFTRINNTDMYMDTGVAVLRGVPADIHKVFLIEARDMSETSGNVGLTFTPLPYHHHTFQSARTQGNVDASNNVIYYAILQPGGPVVAPEIRVAPTSTSIVPLTIGYVPVLGDLVTGSIVPIPGESTNALVAWTTAFARAKEREDGSPDPNLLAVYATEKQHILESLGQRQYQEPSYVDAVFEEYG